MRNSSHAKLNIPMCIACVLLCLTLVSVHLTSGLYAKYVTSGLTSDAARVAKFEINVKKGDIAFDSDLQLDIRPGTSIKQIQIGNHSEVAVQCVVTAENTTGNIPLQFSLDPQGTPDGDKVPFLGECQKSFSMAANSTAVYDLSVIWSEDDDAIQHMGMVDLVTLNIRAEQID